MLQRTPAPHVAAPGGISRVMLWVAAALVPGLLGQLWWFGPGVLIQTAWCALIALAAEALVLRLRGQSVAVGLGDCSALICALLLGLTLPGHAPWYVGLTAALSAVLLGKHVYGGLGHNPFNPAMIGYVVALVGFPIEMTRWTHPDAGVPLAEIWAGFGGALLPDGWTAATALEVFKLERGGMYEAEFKAARDIFGLFGGRGVEWINALYLAGGLLLLQRRIITWHGPLGLLSVLGLCALLGWDGGSSQGHGSVLLHLFSGATMLGAWFILTDPVSTSATPWGRFVCGALAGAATYAIRIWGTYPDAIAFGVLLSNFAAPLIDYYLRPRVYGHGRGQGSE